MKKIKIVFQVLALIIMAQSATAQMKCYAVTPQGVITSKKTDCETISSITSLNAIDIIDGKLVRFTIESFRLTLVRQGMKPVEVPCSSETFSSEIIETLKKCEGSGHVYFEYVRVKVADGTTRSVRPTTYDF